MADLSRVVKSGMYHDIYIFLLFLNVKLIIDYNLFSVMTSLKIFDMFNIVIVSN